MTRACCTVARVRRGTGKRKRALTLSSWCRRPDSNRHGETPLVFETSASTHSATSACSIHNIFYHPMVSLSQEGESPRGSDPMNPAFRTQWPGIGKVEVRVLWPRWSRPPSSAFRGALYGNGSDQGTNFPRGSPKIARCRHGAIVPCRIVCRPPPSLSPVVTPPHTRRRTPP